MGANTRPSWSYLDTEDVDTVVRKGPPPGSTPVSIENRTGRTRKVRLSHIDMKFGSIVSTVFRVTMAAILVLFLTSPIWMILLAWVGGGSIAILRIIGLL